MKPRAPMHRPVTATLGAGLLLIALACGLFETRPTPGVVDATPPPLSPIAVTATAVPPTSTAVPTATEPSPTHAPTPTATAPVEDIHVAPGATHATVTGRLSELGKERFLLHLEAGQMLEVSATSNPMDQDLRLAITGAGGAVVKPLGVPFVRATISTTQDYLIDLVSDAGAISYTLGILLPIRITLAPGETTATVPGRLEATASRHYVLAALADQTMTLDTETTSGEVRLVVYGADGTVLQSGMGDLPNFEGGLPSTQDYIIAVQAGPDTPAAYTLVVGIMP
jgi:hypothetical protein